MPYKNPEDAVKKSKEYYLKNKERLNNGHKIWCLKNKKKVKNYNREWAKSHKKQRKRYRQLHYEEHKKELKKYYQKNAIRLALKRHKQTLERKNKVISYFGGKCIKCGFSDIRALQLDHINGGGTKEIAHKSSRYLYLQALSGKRKGEFQLLCANCNWIKRYENRKKEIPHKHLDLVV